MAASTYQVIALAIYFVAMIAIGLWANSKNNSLDDYVLGGRQLSPTVAALSAGASDMSGWLLMGLPGAVYLSGLSQAWLAVGLTIGAWCNWKFVAPRLRSYTEVAGDAVTVPVFLSNRLHDTKRVLRIVSGVVILVFFTFYVSSGMVAAGKFFESSFGWTYLHGVLLVAAITLVYTLFGGFLGATLTDVAQGLLMFAALVAVPFVAIFKVGSPGEIADGARAVNPDVFNLFAGDDGAGLLALGIFSTAAWGLGYFGQPHIIVRFMALRTPHDAAVARRVGIGWMALSVFGAVMVALVGIAYFQANPGTTLEDPETVFLVLASIMFHPFVAGLVLAAVLAAIMSTLSSQLIVCSSALVEDLYMLRGRTGSPTFTLWLGRIGVLVVALVAGLLALNPDSSVLELVSFAWAGFGAAFGPVILLALYWPRFTSWGAMAAMLTGAAVAWVWSEASAETWEWFGLYELLPGFVAALVVGVVVSLVTQRSRRVQRRIDAEFTGAIDIVAGREPHPDVAPATMARDAAGGSTAAAADPRAQA